MAQHVLYLTQYIDAWRESYFSDLHSYRVGNLIQFGASPQKDEAVEAFSVLEHQAVCALMAQVVSTVVRPKGGDPFDKVQIYADCLGNIITTKNVLMKAASPADSKIIRSEADCRYFMDMFSEPAPDDEGIPRLQCRKTLYDITTGRIIETGIRRRWKKLNIDLLCSVIDDDDVPGLSIFLERYQNYRATLGLN